MKRRFLREATSLKQFNAGENNINTWCCIFKRQDPSFNEDIFKRYIKGECGPNGGKIRKKPKSILYDGLDLSEMIEGEE